LIDDTWHSGTQVQTMLLNLTGSCHGKHVSTNLLNALGIQGKHRYLEKEILHLSKQARSFL